jgi:hypothetical protein
LGGLRSTEEAFLLPTQQPQVRMTWYFVYTIIESTAEPSCSRNSAINEYRGHLSRYLHEAILVGASKRNNTLSKLSADPYFVRLLPRPLGLSEIIAVPFK